ncbi:MAG: hypothetical protein L6Q98_20235 [Anaerolineae bacterium]|nr:hypothetical protein [Anaerolineae bacterium]NUQ06844.1 hypothetical protein [Anaerolineae bacterium]
MKKSIWIVPVLLGLAALACSGTLTGIVSPPVYVCPTPVIVTPIPLPTLPPIPGYPTLIPFPTALPPPTVTPYAIRPPDPFYRGDPVFTRSPQSARFRLTNVYAVNTPAGRTVAVWEIEIKNLDGGVYDVFPAYQSYVNQLVGGATGTWGATADAAVDAGLSIVYEAVGLAPGETGTFALAGFIPYGTVPDRVTFMLDPNTRPTPPPRLPGSNALIWSTETNPYCGGAIADPPAGVLPPP